MSTLYRGRGRGRFRGGRGMGGIPGPGQRFRGGQPGPSAQAGGAGKLMQGPARHSELAEMTAANATAQPDPVEKATPAAYQTPTAPITKRQRTTVAEQGSRKRERKQAFKQAGGGRINPDAEHETETMPLRRS